MHHTALWNVYIHGFLFSGRVIITDAVGIRSYRVSPINVLLDTFSPRPSLASDAVIGPVTTTRSIKLPITFRIGGIW